VSLLIFPLSFVQDTSKRLLAAASPFRKGVRGFFLKQSGQLCGLASKLFSIACAQVLCDNTELSGW